MIAVKVKGYKFGQGGSPMRAGLDEPGEARRTIEPLGAGGVKKTADRKLPARDASFSRDCIERAMKVLNGLWSDRLRATRICFAFFQLHPAGLYRDRAAGVSHT